jgi:hypothetical protein
MPWFEIAYSEDPTSKALLTTKLLVRDRDQAAAAAMNGLASAQTMHGAKCYRVMDGRGLVVARGPRERPPSQE